jgi:hypothetical protein
MVQVFTILQITGRKENVEEAKRRVLAQVERLVNALGVRQSTVS